MIGLMDKTLVIGKEVSLRLEDLHPKGRMEVPYCKVNNINEEGIFINTPFIESRYLQGRKVEILWENEMFLYCLSSNIKRCVQANDTTLLIDHDGILRSIDERRYFKLKNSINIEFRPFDSDGLFASAEVLDVGGGGIQFLTSYPLVRGQKVEMLIEVPIFPYLDISAIGEVIIIKRFREIEGSQIGVCFLEIDPIGKKRLFKYILDEQQPLKFKEELDKADLKFWFSLC